MKNYKQGSTTLLIIIGILLVIAAIAYFIIQKGQTIPPSPEAGTPSQTPAAATTTAMDSMMGTMPGWQTYVNTQFGFTFMYPANYGVNAVVSPTDGSQFEWQIRPTKSLDGITIGVYADAATLKKNLSSGNGCSSTPTTFGSNGASALLYTCKGSVATQKYYIALINNYALTVAVVHDSGQADLGLSNIPSDTINQIYSSFTISQ